MKKDRKDFLEGQNDTRGYALKSMREKESVGNHQEEILVGTLYTAKTRQRDGGNTKGNGKWKTKQKTQQGQIIDDIEMRCNEMKKPAQDRKACKERALRTMMVS